MPDMLVITPDSMSERIDVILGSCLAEDGNIFNGVLHDYAINTKLLEPFRSEVRAMIDLLPTEFLLEDGGGWSFLNLCQTKDGVLWTGLHLQCERLFILALALGYALPLAGTRDFWKVLPGGLPYVQFTLRSATDA